MDDEALSYILDQFSAWGGVTARKMFGGAGLYRDGVIFGLVADDIVYLKVGDANRARFKAKGMEAFRPFEDKPTVMSYYQLPEEVLENPCELMEWAAEAWKVSMSSRSNKRGK